MDQIYTVDDYYDGPVSGVASFKGEPHYYECIFDESEDEYSKNYYLSPISATTFRLVQEQWEIWLRWNTAFKKGEVTAGSHPVLPEDATRDNELDKLTRTEKTISTERAVLAKADFKIPKEPGWASEWAVVWETVDVT